LGLMKYAMKWVHSFLTSLRLQYVYDSVLASSATRRYPTLFLPSNPYSALPVDQLHGKEYRNYGKVLLAAFTVTVWSKMDSNRDRYEIGLAIKAVQALTDFCLMAQYRSHMPATLHYMQRYLADFHKYKHVLASA